MSCVGRLGLILAAVTSTAPLSRAQGRGPQTPATLRIAVVDATGAVLVGAHVALDDETGTVVTAETNGRGEATFPQVTAGRYTVRVEFAGFERYEARGVRVRSGDNRRDVKLTIAKYAETVQVERDARERGSDLRGDAFTTVLRPEHIAALPDDPEEMERALAEMAGPGAVIRVNGFRGGRLPPKGDIQLIRFRRGTFAADTHEAGVVFVDVLTKPGGATWRATSSASLRDSALDARPALAPEKAGQRAGRYAFTAGGPLWRKHTSLTVTADGLDASDARTIHAATPDGPLTGTVRGAARVLNGSVRLEHALAASQVLRGEFQRNHASLDNVGAGDANLPDRGYRQTASDRVSRIALSGFVARALFSEFKLQERGSNHAFAPASRAPAVIVLNAFAAGGAQIDGTRRWRQTDLSEDIDVAIGNHAVRTGLLLTRMRLDTDVLRNGAGTFTFASLDAYRDGAPTTFVRNVGDPRVAGSMWQVGAYVQDDVRVRNSLTLSGGVRQEWQSPIGGLHLGPRGGVAWSPFKSGATTVRAGAGVFFEWLDAGAYEQMRQLDGVHQRIEATLHPGYPSPSAGEAVTLPPGLVRLGGGVTQPRVVETLASVEQSFARDVRAAATLIHRSGARALRAVNVNAPTAGGQRPDPRAGPISEIQSAAASRYDGVTLAMTYAPAQGRVFANVSYTAARALDAADDALALPADGRDLAREWGPALTDARHRVSALASGTLFKRVRAGLSLRAQSALPYNITTGRDDNGDTISNDRPAGVSRNSARGRAQMEVSARVSRSFGFGDRAIGAGPAGPQGRTRGDDANPLAAFGGGIDVTRRVNADVYLQAFNLLNRTNATMFSGVETSPFFGQPMAAAPPRRIEIGLRVSF